MIKTKQLVAQLLLLSKELFKRVRGVDHRIAGIVNI